MVLIAKNCLSRALFLNPITVRIQMASHRTRRGGIAALGLTLILCWVLHPTVAEALPSFASQTGLPCTQCHVVGFGPALTPYGRQFKLNGYVFGNGSDLMPFAGFVQTSITHTGTAQPTAPAPGFGLNNDFAVDQVSGFYGGRITQNLGAFVQVTYDGVAKHAAWDNLDVRYARTLTFGSNAVVVGVSVNNNPTVQDLWNSTPAWGFPYVASALAPVPAATTLVASKLSTVSLGATVYAMIDDLVYLEAGGYKGLSNRGLNDVGLYPSNNIELQGVAPYERAVLQFSRDNQSWSAGLLALQGGLQPDSALGGRDDYRDIGVDATYEYLAAPTHGLQANVALIHESRTLNQSAADGAATYRTGDLKTFNANATYVYRQTWAATLGWFKTTGNSDPLLYPTGPVTGSANSSPDSGGYTLGLECIPFGKLNSLARPYLNVRTGLQYTIYSRFNGGTFDYDGNGRSASQNDTLYGYVWIAF
jgi:hypothetical protein